MIVVLLTVVLVLSVCTSFSLCVVSLSLPVVSFLKKHHFSYSHTSYL